MFGLYVFICIFSTFACKLAQTWFPLIETLHSTLFGIYYCVEVVRIEKVICYKIRAKYRFYGFLSFFGTFSHKVAETWFLLHETWHTTLFGIYYCVQMVIIEYNSHMLEIPP